MLTNAFWNRRLFLFFQLIHCFGSNKFTFALSQLLTSESYASITYPPTARFLPRLHPFHFGTPHLALSFEVNPYLMPPSHTAAFCYARSRICYFGLPTGNSNAFSEVGENVDGTAILEHEIGDLKTRLRTCIPENQNLAEALSEAYSYENSIVLNAMYICTKKLMYMAELHLWGIPSAAA